MAEERRKSLQQYLRDLWKIEEIRDSDILNQFLEINEVIQNIKKSSLTKSGFMLM